jgi:hypothetical protein
MTINVELKCDGTTWTCVLGNGNVHTCVTVGIGLTPVLALEECINHMICPNPNLKYRAYSIEYEEELKLKKFTNSQASGTCQPPSVQG